MIPPPTSLRSRPHGVAPAVCLAMCMAMCGVLWLQGCASSAPMVDLVPVPAASARYLRSPMEDLPGGVEASPDLGAAFERLVSGGSSTEARAVAAAILEEDAGSLPAALLLAQTDFVDGLLSPATERIRPWVQAQRAYTPATLLWARLMELEGDVIEAYASYRAVADRVATAAQARDALSEKTRRTLLDEVRVQAARLRLTEANRTAALLREWFPRVRGCVGVALASCPGEW